MSWVKQITLFADTPCNISTHADCRRFSGPKKLTEYRPTTDHQWTDAM